MKAQSRTVLRKALSIMLCLFATLSAAAPCLAAGNETRTVKVGFFAFDGYHMQDENGARSGYGYEMLQYIAGYAGLHYEYVGYDKSWSEMQDMLERGEIDMLTSAQKTPEREAQFDFSDSDIGTSAAILTASAGDTRFVAADYANWNGMRVGMIHGNSRNDSFAAFAAEHGFTYTPVYFDNTDEMISELKSDDASKSIDAVVTSNLRSITDEWLLAQFDSSPFYIMVQKGNRELLNRINTAISQVDASEPDLHTMLMNKYYSPDSGDEIAFTMEERTFIKEHMRGRTLTALVHPDYAPYSWAQNGKLTGIFCDAAREIALRCGLNIEFLEIHNEEEYAAALREGAADIRFDAVLEYNRAEAEGYWLTGAYAQTPVARLHRETVFEYHTIAVIQGSNLAPNYIAELMEDGCDIVEYASVDDVVAALMNRDADMALLGFAAAEKAAWDEPTSSLEADEISSVYTPYAVAVNNACDPLLYAIFSKAASSIEEQDMSAFTARYASTGKKPLDLIGYCVNHPTHATIAVMIVIIIVMLFVGLFHSIKKRNQVIIKEAEEQRQNQLLTDALSNAERANAAKSQFLSRVSHEMRTPLNAIIGFIELAKGANKEQTENYLASSDLAAKQLLNVINDVLDMSSIESGKLKIANAPFNFRHLITSITNIYGTQCKQKGIDFETKITTPTEDWLVGDELRVNQILMNLLGNAAKFTAEGGITLKISETAVDEERLFLRFEVSDTGCGMSEEMKERLFKPFEQESASTAKKYGGSGLGLSIVKNLVSMMGGSVRVDSAQGVGTTFTVELPFMKSNVESDAVLIENVKSLRILAVDDEKAERDYMGVVLGRMGVRYTCVAGGSEALEELERSEKEHDLYNVCIVDWKMPEMDGMDTTKRIRKRYGKDVVVIVASAYVFHQAGQSATAAGANLFVSKPLFQSSLFDLLMTLTQGEIAKVDVKTAPQKWDFAGRRVLLVEDNALNQIVAQGYLSKYNVAVDVANNGQIAADMFLASAPGYYGAILMDIQMPVMDGFEATKAIRKSSHPEAKTIQIIAQTADAFNEDIARALSCGMNEHITKPIEPELLAKALCKAFA